MKLLIIAFTLFCSSISVAGGNFDKATITSVSSANGHFVFEFKWANESGFFSEQEISKFEFDHLNWNGPIIKWYQYLKLKGPLSFFFYPKSDMTDCEKLILKAFNKRSPVNLGQMGSKNFAESRSNPGTFIVPFTKPYVQHRDDGSTITACMLYAAPT